MFHLNFDNINFPPVKLANNEGLLAIGGDLSVKRLIKAYQNGIFPWYGEGFDILWWAPDPRMVLFPDEVKISKSMRAFMRKTNYNITVNKDFEAVINNCATVKRNGDGDGDGAWLHREMREAYIRLYYENRAFSVEVWNEKNELVGGLYAVKSNDKVWSGESMFHKESNTSKLAFFHLAKMARENDIKIIDCQQYTDHLASLGGREISRADFMKFFE